MRRIEQPAPVAACRNRLAERRGRDRLVSRFSIPDSAGRVGSRRPDLGKPMLRRIGRDTLHLPVSLLLESRRMRIPYPKGDWAEPLRPHAGSTPLTFAPGATRVAG